MAGSCPSSLFCRSRAGNMIPPTSNHLKALAGWSISANTSNLSDRQKLALHAFKNGCVELAQVVADLQTNVQKKAVSVASPPKHMPGPAFSPEIKTIPTEVQAATGVAQNGECCHKFDIRTQHCLYCGISYRKAMGRRSELM